MTDKQLVKFARAFRSGILGKGSSYSMCLAIVAPLCALLQCYGVDCEVCESTGLDGEFWNHFWIKLSDGRALDPTADQFAEIHLPKVYLGQPIPQLHKN